VALLAVIAAVLIIVACQANSPAYAQPIGAGGEPQGVFAVAGQISRDAYGLYLVDPQQSTVVVYEYNPGTRRLRLAASRTFLFDRQLESYNTDPLPSEVADMVRQARRIPDTTTQP
jgi:hypothetical protein